MNSIFRPARHASCVFTFPVTVTAVVLTLVEGGVASLVGVAKTLALPWTLRGPLAAAPLAAVTATVATALSAAAANTFLISFLSLASVESRLLLFLVVLLRRTEEVRREGGGASTSGGSEVLQAEEVLDGAEDRVRVV